MKMQEQRRSLLEPGIDVEYNFFLLRWLHDSVTRSGYPSSEYNASQPRSEATEWRPGQDALLEWNGEHWALSETWQCPSSIFVRPAPRAVPVLQSRLKSCRPGNGFTSMSCKKSHFNCYDWYHFSCSFVLWILIFSMNWVLLTITNQRHLWATTSGTCSPASQCKWQ